MAHGVCVYLDGLVVVLFYFFLLFHTYCCRKCNRIFTSYLQHISPPSPQMLWSMCKILEILVRTVGTIDFLGSVFLFSLWCSFLLPTRCDERGVTHME